MLILGAGMAGCLASILNGNAKILEPKNKIIPHKALLRFRSDRISQATGIPFKKVKVYKGIWHNDSPVQLSPRYINLYSRKVSDKFTYRSIVNQDPVDRWVAPLDFHDQLLDMAGDITYNSVFPDDINKHSGKQIISTLPISVLADMYNYDMHGCEFKHSEIKVSKFKVPDCDVDMTYYYTDPTINIYRASISCGLLIIESMWDINENDIKVVIRSFGLTGMNLEQVEDNFTQKNGKIVSADDELRKQFIVDMTTKHNVYSLGRFATWRNLVMDDVYLDILKIKELLNKSNYDRIIK